MMSYPRVLLCPVLLAIFANLANFVILVPRAVAGELAAPVSPFPPVNILISPERVWTGEGASHMDWLVLIA